MTMSAALEEAYASQPIDEMVFDTLEFHHPSFVDDLGVRTAIRVVCDTETWSFKLEPSAPLNGGQYVDFLPVPFQLTEPGYAENQVPTLSFSISNVSRLVTRYLELAIGQTTPITMIYRNYLQSDTSTPQVDPVVTMTLTAAEASTMQVTGTATLSDVHNWPFPAQKYTPKRFPGLLR